MNNFTLDKTPFVWYIILMNNEMKEMNKAFEDFSKACDRAIGKCQDFIDMDINKTTKPTLEERASSPADDVRKEPTQRDEVATIKTSPYERKRLEPLPASKLGCPRSP